MEQVMEQFGPYIGEFVGTAILMLLGNGVVANVCLDKTKGNDAGWIVITFGWGMAVFIAVLCVQDFSGAHINPAVTLGVAAAGKFAWAQVPGFIVAQMLGAMLGTGLVYLAYRDHYHATKDPDVVLGTFCNAPAIRNLPLNTVCEAIGTFVLVFAVLMIVHPDLDYESAAGAEKIGLGSLGALPVGLLVFAIGLSLGGTTGYAINPARDLAPRIVHALLPITGKRDSDWSYSWVPVVGPILGGLVAAGIFRLMTW